MILTNLAPQLHSKQHDGVRGTTFTELTEQQWTLVNSEEEVLACKPRLVYRHKHYGVSPSIQTGKSHYRAHCTTAVKFELVCLHQLYRCLNFRFWPECPLRYRRKFFKSLHCNLIIPMRSVYISRC